MSLLKQAIFRLKKRWSPDRASRELDDEFRFHVEMEARDLMLRGVPPAEARRAAERDFGDRARFKEEALHAGALPRLEGLLTDARMALRQVRLNPVFAAVAVVTLAIGVGASTAIFSVVNDVLLQPLPYEDPDELVVLKEYLLERGIPDLGTGGQASYLNFTDWRAWPGREAVLDDLALRASTSVLLGGASEPLRVRAGLVTGNYFGLLGVEATLGRVLSDADPESAVVLSDALWREVFAADADVLGGTVSLDGLSHIVVGVLPAWFDAGGATRVWKPLTDDNHPFLQQRMLRAYGVVGRLAAGVSVAQARQTMSTVREALAEAYPEENENWSVQLVPMHDDIVGPVRGTLVLMFAAVGLLLLLACANVANLVLARSTGRRQETALRVALGAGRGRMAQQLVVESAVLALLGGAAGLLLGVWGARVIVALTPFTVPLLERPSVDLSVFLFALAVSLASGVLFGLAPLAQRDARGLADPLRRGAHGAQSVGRGARRLRGGLVVAQVALSLILLVTAGLLISSFTYLWGYEAGFEADNVLTMEIVPVVERYPEPVQQGALYEEIYARLREIPQVTAVGGITRLPLGSGNIQMTIEGQGSPRAESALLVNGRPISGDYFEALRIPQLAGRSFRASGDEGVVILNDLAARELWPQETPGDAVGRHVRLVLRGGVGDWMRVVGVVGSTRHAGLDPDPRPEVYQPHSARGFGVNVVVARTRGDPLEVAASARQAVYAADPEQPISDMQTMDAVIRESMRRPRFYATLFGTFGVLALAMAVAGVFAVAAYATSRRRREIGVRMAIGARGTDVVRLVLGEGLLLIGAGVGLGLAASLAVRRYLTDFLFGTSPSDPATLAAATAVLALAALVGFWLPARQAARIDPTEALRLE